MSTEPQQPQISAEPLGGLSLSDGALTHSQLAGLGGLFEGGGSAREETPPQSVVPETTVAETGIKDHVKEEVEGLRSSLYSLEDRLGDELEEIKTMLLRPRPQPSGFGGQA